MKNTGPFQNPSLKRFFLLGSITFLLLVFATYVRFRLIREHARGKYIMEYLKVNFPQQREVFVNGIASGGETNRPLMINVHMGTHRISLSDPQNYAPPSQEVELRGTSYANPKEITFV